jgi:transcriptional regulator
MRRLAQELHVAPGALYYHVKNKQQLLILLADYILARAPKSMSEEAEPNPEAIRASMIRRGDLLFSLLYPIRECPEVVRLSLALHPRELKPVVAMAHEFQALGLGHAEALRRARLLTHIALSLVEEYQTLPLISPQEAVASGDVPLIENAFNRYRQDLLSAIDTMMVVQEPYTQDA